MKTTSGKAPSLDRKNLARHEVCGDIGDFIEAAKRLLRFGGSFYAVYRPDRLTDLITKMREGGIEPKRMTFVHANQEKESSMVLVEGKRGGKSGLILTPPLIIYKDGKNKEYSYDMNYIMENGVFPEKFSR
jgi:tRNA1(Val) A37 N6-methylase TrmN6